MGPEPEQMDLDASLSLTAEGLWSDEESLDEPQQSSEEEQDFSETNRPRGRRRKKHEKSPPPQIKNLLAHATSLYASGDLSGAKSAIHEIITLDNESVQGYTLLSHIYEDMGMKTEAVNALVSAAMNSQKDATVWIRAARMSRDLGFWQQAIKCYDTGLRLEPEDWNVLYERSVIHAEHGSYKKALDGFTTLLELYPMDMTVIRDLAKLYNTHNRDKDAIQLYEEARAYYMNLPQLETEPNGDLRTPFDWNELNILMGLLASSVSPLQSISTIHSTSRWLRGRSAETFWDLMTDSREWDEDDVRRSQVQSFEPGKWDPLRYSLPIEIRVHLGINWLRARNLSEAMKQFFILEREDIEIFTDLFWDVAEALRAHDHPKQALQFYEALSDQDQVCPSTSEQELMKYNGPQTWSAMGRCYESLNKLEQAEECYTLCAHENPTDFDTRLRLAEILESTNRKEEAIEIVASVKRDREIFQRSDVEAPQDTDSLSGALIPNRKRIHPSPSKPVDPNSPTKPRKRNNEKAAIEARLREHVLNAWDKLETLKPGMTIGKREDVDTWMTIARDLIDEFKSVKSFFPIEKNRRITWFDENPSVKEGVGRKRKAADIEMRVEEMQNRLQGNPVIPEEPVVHEKHDLSKETFRGLEFEQWFYIFIQYALLQTQYVSHAEADVTLKFVYDANVFFQNTRFMRILNTANLACAMYVGSIPEIANYVRNFMQTYQFRSDPYRLYYLALGTGIGGVEQFHLAVDQKYLLRQVKAMDGLLSGETIMGAATIADNPDIEKCELTHANPSLLMLYGHRLAAGGSFAPAQNYYFRARELVKDDPLLELSIGLTYLHRAMQRQTDNRHIQILQGLTFIFQYYRGMYARSSKYDGIAQAAMRQQAEYNVGRAFHQLGLMTFAVKYYENAIKISEENGGLGLRDLVFETAHNLNLIFCLSANEAAAKEITEKYLVL